MRCVHTPRSSQQTVPWIRHATHFSPSINRFLIGHRYASPTNGPPWPNSTFIRLTWSLYLAKVFIFTAALFLSGYAIQLRTLRDLRAAIKPTPRPSPRTYLPDQFRKMTTELPDGTIVPVQDDGVVIEIKPTPPSEVHQTSETEDENRQKPIPAPQPAQEPATAKTEMKKTSSARAQKYREQQQLKKQQQQHMQQEGLVVQQGREQQEQDFSKTPNQAEQQETSGSTPIEIPEGMLEHPDPDKRAEKAVSPAERRRLIKEEIKRLAQPEERGYYQRRLW